MNDGITTHVSGVKPHLLDRDACNDYHGADKIDIDKPHISSQEQQQQSVKETKKNRGDTSTTSTTLTGTSSLYADEFIAEVDKHYMRVCILAVLTWLFLVIISFLIGKKYNRIVKLSGIEQKAPMVASMLLAMSLISCVLPLLVSGNKRCMSGVIVCAIVVQSIALLTDMAMAFFPTPVFIDPITGTNAYLLRYCEWTPLSFTMAFLTESCRMDTHRHDDDDDDDKMTNSGDKAKRSRSGRISFIVDAMSTNVDRNRNGNGKSHPYEALMDVESEEDLRKRVQKLLQPAYYLAITQGLSTFCGWVFPMCSNIYSWTTCMIISCVLFSVLWKRLFARTAEFQKLQMGSTLSEREMYKWSKLSLGLLKTCTYVWSVLVVVFFLCSFGPHLFDHSVLFRVPGLSMMLESTLDVLFKAIYLLIVIDVHDTIFDSNARTERRLEELRQMLGVVWDNSSDVIGISVRGVSGDVTTMISPTYRKVYFDKNSDTDKNHDADDGDGGGKALAFDLDARCVNSGKMEDILPANVYDLDFQDLSHSERPHKREKSVSLEMEEVASMAKLVVRAWKEDSPKSSIMHDLVRRNGSPRVNIRCEANITRLEENALILVIRDISERFRRFEAEKKVVSETTARIKDAAANRFTRHEVKNGLLAAIGLCDSLNESFEDLTRSGTEFVSLQEADKGETNVSDVATKRYLVELDKTLHEILDTILAEAMARDVIHEVYEPKMEKVDVLEVLHDSMNLNANKSHAQRFPIESSPSPLPKFALDPQLLKYIHRNAISNACKYGKKSGTVTTFVEYNEERSELRMEVTNLPGQLHSEILKLGSLAEEVVFSPRRRLAMHCKDDQDNRFSASHSSGDGAWIMKQCAKTLGGKCGIKFEHDKTVFSFSCPVKLFDEKLANSNIKYEDFELPTNLYAIAIDDSKIQRKLLSKFFSFAGIPEERIHILGEGVEEITSFCDWAISFVNEHPDDYILMVVDENLEVQEEQGGTKHTMVSGSRSVAEMRWRLLKDQERKILALIRSANDSASDVALYNSRAHGYLPKTPVKKQQVLEVLAPLWLSRFPQFVPLKTGRAINDYEEAVIVTVDDMMVLIDEIDRYSLLPSADLAEKWQIVVEKLHALRGDLLIMPNRGHVLNTAISLLGDLRESTPPKNFARIWKSIRSILLDTC
mmetsp:Transcript_3353/g.6269  ORF Transcript_3353/g.6269 Transcript_3353/m.6269 type:complete len:1165 (-) Transcript_3353:172-3666(-)